MLLSRRASPKLSSVAQVSSTVRGSSMLLRAMSRQRMTETDAAATQIAQLIPGLAEKRRAAPAADVSRAAVQVIVTEGSRMVPRKWCRVLYIAKSNDARRRLVLVAALPPGHDRGALFAGSDCADLTLLRATIGSRITFATTP